MAGSDRVVRVIDGRKLVLVMPAYNAEATLERTVAEVPKIVDHLILVDVDVRRENFRAVFPNTQFVAVSTQHDYDRYAAHGHHPPKWAYTHTQEHWRSAALPICTIFQ